MKTNCESCGKSIDDNRSATREDGACFCRKCASVMRSTCLCCGKVDQTWNMTSTSQGETYCETCATAFD